MPFSEIIMKSPEESFTNLSGQEFSVLEREHLAKDDPDKLTSLLEDEIAALIMKADPSRRLKLEAMQNRMDSRRRTETHPIVLMQEFYDESLISAVSMLPVAADAVAQKKTREESGDSAPIIPFKR